MSAATQGWRGGAAELALGGGSAGGAAFCRGSREGPAPVHLMLPMEHATLLVPNESGVLETYVPSMPALHKAREAVWDSLAAHTRVHTPLAGACEKLCPWERCIMALHIGV